jgi:hypothetical protein
MANATSALIVFVVAISSKGAAVAIAKNSQPEIKYRNQKVALLIALDIIIPQPAHEVRQT